MHHADGYRAREFNAEITVGNAVKRIHHRRGHSEEFCGAVAVYVVGSSGKRAAAERGNIHAAQGVVKSLDIAEKHLSVRHHVMTECDGLGALEMRITRHDGFGVFVCDIAEDLYQRNYQSAEFLYCVAQVQPDIKSHLVVPGTGSVQALAYVAKALREFRFDEHVDIFCSHVELQLAAFDICEDLFQTTDKLQAVVHADYALFAEHCGMRDAALDILFVHSSVKRNR